MASYSLVEFLGTGLLKDTGGKLAEDGWDTVPTLKLIGAEDMDALALTNAQRDALELRTYLHNRCLMKYADIMEASRLGLTELLSMKPADLASKFRMRKTHVATFVDTSISSGIEMPPDLVFSTSRRRRSSAGSYVNSPGIERPLLKPFQKPLLFEVHKSTVSDASPFGRSKRAPAYPPRKSNATSMGQKMPSVSRSLDAIKSNASKGVFSTTTSTTRRLCGLVKAPGAENVTKLSVLERISLRPLAPDHRNGVGVNSLKGKKLQPFKASNLWSDKATLFVCLRRPGCVMCRAEAHQLFARKPVFDALGIQLVAVLLEDVDEEVWAFWPRYWAGMVVLDEKREFFRALGGGNVMKDNLFTGFLLNPIARLNWKRAMKTGIHYNAKGQGLIKGGLLIVRRGKGGVAYQFAEKSFGDWAPLDEVLQVCHVIREEGDCYDF